MNKVNGFLYGLLSSAAFGMIPLFAIPAMQSGMSFMSVLLYRFIFASAALAILLLVSKLSFKIKKTDIIPLLILTGLYLVSSIFLLWGYTFMGGGIATTLHFMYPVLTTLIMMVFFHERASFLRILAIALAVVGVYFLSKGENGDIMNPIGIIIVLISALGYALYLVAISQLRKLEVKGFALTFYIFFFGSLAILAGMGVTQSIEPISSTKILGNLIMLAIVPTVISNLSLIRAIQCIGSTQTSVLGAMEPVTAVCIGILVFDEPFTQTIAMGILLILSAVIILILKK